MTIERALFLEDSIKSTDTKELIKIVMDHLKDIKDTLQILKMIVLELQKRKEK